MKVVDATTQKERACDDGIAVCILEEFGREMPQVNIVVDNSFAHSQRFIVYTKNSEDFAGMDTLMDIARRHALKVSYMENKLVMVRARTTFKMRRFTSMRVALAGCLLFSACIFGAFSYLSAPEDAVAPFFPYALRAFPCYLGIFPRSQCVASPLKTTAANDESTQDCDPLEEEGCESTSGAKGSGARVDKHADKDVDDPLLVGLESDDTDEDTGYVKVPRRAKEPAKAAPVAQKQTSTGKNGDSPKKPGVKKQPSVRDVDDL